MKEKKKNPQVDNYLVDGCGRCAYYKTPKCKVHTWQAELKLLRKVVLDCGLEEGYKWSQPCYLFENKNVLIVSAFKDYAFISFFKGSLLKDPDQLLSSPGKSSQATRQLRFTTTKQVMEMSSYIKSFVSDSIKLEEKGLKVQFKKRLEPIPEELIEQFEKNPNLKIAFEGLTPGRQRGYVIYFSQPKHSKTRTMRIEKWVPVILEGKGIQDEYRSTKK